MVVTKWHRERRRANSSTERKLKPRPAAADGGLEVFRQVTVAAQPGELDQNVTRTHTTRRSPSHAIGTSPMPEIAAAPPAPSCSHLLFEGRIQQFQTLDPD